MRRRGTHAYRQRVRVRNDGGELLLQQWIKKSDTGNLV